MKVQLVIYFIGVFVLGWFNASLKAATGGGVWFVLAAIAYLLVLRLIGYGVERLMRSSAPTNGS
jgi:O-antigen/teichoic acid export membrane protein